MVFSIHNIYISILLILLFFLPIERIVPYGTLPSYWILLGVFFWIKNQRTKVPKNDFAMLIFGLTMALSILVNYNEVDFLHVQSYTLTIITYFVVRSLKFNEKLEPTVYSILLTFILFISCLVFYQYAKGINDSGNVNATYLADSHLLALLICASYGFVQSKNLANSKIIVSILVGINCTTLIFLSGSRAGVISFIILNIIMIFYYSKKKLRYPMVFLFIFLFYVIFNQINFFFDLFVNYFGSNLSIDIARTKYSRFFFDDSVDERLSIWSVIINSKPTEILEILGFGLGPGGYGIKYSKNVHNLFFDYLYSIGFVGMLSVFYLMIYSLKVSLFGLNNTFLKALGFCLLVILIFCMFHDFGRVRILWVIVGLIFAIISENKVRST